MNLVLAASDGLFARDYVGRSPDWAGGKQIRNKIIAFIRDQDIGDTQQAIVARASAADWACEPQWDSAGINSQAGHAFCGLWRWERVPRPSGRGGAERQRVRMVHGATHALIFWDGKSKGTADLITKVEEKKIPYCIHVF